MLMRLTCPSYDRYARIETAQAKKDAVDLSSFHLQFLYQRFATGECHRYNAESRQFEFWKNENEIYESTDSEEMQYKLLAYRLY